MILRRAVSLGDAVIVHEPTSSSVFASESESFFPVYREPPQPRVAGICGWRLNELLSCKKSDVRFEKGVLYLDALHSKNGDERYFQLIKELREALEEQLEFVRKLKLEHQMVISWLFPNADPRHPIGERMYRFDTAPETACEAAGLNIDPDTGERCVHPATDEPLKRGFHDFRRTAQDFLEELGLSDSDIMMLVGHTTLLMRIAKVERARRRHARLASGWRRLSQPQLRPRPTWSILYNGCTTRALTGCR